MQNVVLNRWFSGNMQEQIILLEKGYLLLETKTNTTVVLGETIAEVKNKLKELGKAEQFSDFMHTTGVFLMEQIYQRMKQRNTRIG